MADTGDEEEEETVLTPRVKARLLRKIMGDPKDTISCAIWQGPVRPKKYRGAIVDLLPVMHIGPTRYCVRRLVYDWVIGEPIPRGRAIFMTCNTHACVNPNHLPRGAKYRFRS